MSSKRLPRAIAVTTTLVTMVSANLLMVPKPAHATFGTADIKPIESNIAAKPWAAATAATGSSNARLAIDGDPTTSWQPGRAGARQWLTVDLGGTYDNLRKVKVLFPDRGVAHRYVVEASSDGRRWKTIADRSHNRAVSRGEVHLFTRPATRFVRLTFTGGPGRAQAGVSELQVFNYLRDDLTLGA
uniref:discoidin domain-containing protein n=1 Tax=Streptomyces tailanensis TaxID=2569858 RepID=UPI00122EA4D3